MIILDHFDRGGAREVEGQELQARRGPDMCGDAREFEARGDQSQRGDVRALVRVVDLDDGQARQQPVSAAQGRRPHEPGEETGPELAVETRVGANP